jgi:hypothetical protein
VIKPFVESSDLIIGEIIKSLASTNDFILIGKGEIIKSLASTNGLITIGKEKLFNKCNH